MTEQLSPMPEDWQRALAVVAHPDDLEYGAAAAIAAWTDAGKEVSYLLATRGEAGIDGIHPSKAAPLREREQIASAAVVGVTTVEFLDYRDGVIEYGLPLRRNIAAAIRRHRPELVITLNHRDTFHGGFWNTPDPTKTRKPMCGPSWTRPCPPTPRGSAADLRSPSNCSPAKTCTAALPGARRPGKEPRWGGASAHHVAPRWATITARAYARKEGSHSGRVRRS